MDKDGDSRQKTVRDEVLEDKEFWEKRIVSSRQFILALTCMKLTFPLGSSISSVKSMLLTTSFGFLGL